MGVFADRTKRLNQPKVNLLTWFTMKMIFRLFSLGL